MKTSERFNRAMKALIDAFFNETLAKWDCSACACGNIIAVAIGQPLKKLHPTRPGIGDEPNTYWGAVCSYENAKVFNNIEEAKEYYNQFDIFHFNYRTDTEIERGLENIKATGYTVEEFYKIEEAFESNTKIVRMYYDECSKDDIMEDQYNGLIAVVDVLCKIEGIDSKEYKEFFNYSTEFKPLKEYSYENTNI
jgi:hypothetical protein